MNQLGFKVTPDRIPLSYVRDASPVCQLLVCHFKARILEHIPEPEGLKGWCI